LSVEFSHLATSSTHFPETELSGGPLQFVAGHPSRVAVRPSRVNNPAHVLCYQWFLLFTSDFIVVFDVKALDILHAQVSALQLDIFQALCPLRLCVGSLAVSEHYKTLDLSLFNGKAGFTDHRIHVLTLTVVLSEMKLYYTRSVNFPVTFLLFDRIRQRFALVHFDLALCNTHR
jgi:hypothetical protein